jgi:short-subunit dehydrogenase
MDARLISGKGAFPVAVALAAFTGVLLFRSRPGRSLKGLSAIVTGGSRGLGLALALELAKNGASLHLIARDAAELEIAAGKIRRLGASVSIWPCDLRDADAARSTIESIGSQAGRIDLLINNAGTIMVGPWESLDEKDFTEAMALHFWAPFHTVRTALPHLTESRGEVVNIVSIGGRVAVPHLASYTASKFALAGLSGAMQVELAKSGVSVTTVFPGLMRTGSHLNARFKGNVDREFTWFSFAASNPFTAINAHRAARQIVAAIRRRRPVLTITQQARLLTLANALAPNFVGRTTAFINRLLPRSNGNKAVVSGRNCFSSLPPLVNTLGDRAAARLNEVSY